MKKLLLSILLVVLIVACDKEQTSTENPLTSVSAKVKKEKVDVCHKGKIINVSVNALSGHKGHGDAVDMDGDGYFDIANDCTVIDCDDDSYSEDNSCNVMFEGFRDIIGWQYVQAGTSDNFETLDLMVCSDFGEYACSLSSPRLTQEGNVSTYDGGPQFGTITLIFKGNDFGTTNPIYDIEAPLIFSWDDVYFVKRSDYSPYCYPPCESMFPF